MSGSSSAPAPGDSPLSRDTGLALVVAALSSVTREFTARGNYPFKSRSLGRSQLDVLCVLSEADDAGVGVGGLAAALGVTSGAVTQLVDTLRAAGWVTSEVNPADRLARIIRLTAAAEGDLDAFRQDYVSSLAPRFASLTAAEIAELGRLLRTVQTSVPGNATRRGI